jgi:diguanylate cyclase (GGDEF)-like protein/PAS domain S-box-containing protein
MAIFLQLLIFFVAAIEIGLAGYIYFKRPESAVHRLAALRSLNVATLAFLTYLFVQAQSAPSAELWSRFQIAALLFVPATYFIFAWTWSRNDQSKGSRWVLGILLGVTVVFVGLDVASNIWGLPLSSHSGIWTLNLTSTLPLALTTDVFIILVVVIAIYLAARHMSDTAIPRAQRHQGVVFLGIVLPIILVMLFSVLPKMAIPDWPEMLPVWLLMGDVLTIVGLNTGKQLTLENVLTRTEVVAALSDSLVVCDTTGTILGVNPAFANLTGYANRELIGKNLPVLLADETTFTANDLLHVLDNRKLEVDERKLRTRIGTTRLVMRTALAITDRRGRSQGVAVMLRDLTDLEQLSSARNESERHYHSLFEDLPVSIWEEDLTDVKETIDRLHGQGVVDFAGYLESHAHFVEECIQRVKVLAINRAAIKLCGAATREEAMSSLGAIIHDDATALFQKELIALWENSLDFEAEGVNYTLQNQHVDIQLHWSALEKENPFSRLLVIISDITERKHVERERDQLYEEVNLLSTQDFLTGLFNRRHFVTLAQAELERAYRYNHHMSLILMDVDSFKNINDQYGHNSSDQAMQQIAAVFKQTFRKVDILSRYAGDEYIALLPEVGIEDALKAAERLRQHLSETSLSTDAGALWVTASLGAAEVDESMPSLDALLGRAGKALDESKGAGGNRVSVWKE